MNKTHKSRTNLKSRIPRILTNIIEHLPTIYLIFRRFLNSPLFKDTLADFDIKEESAKAETEEMRSVTSDTIDGESVETDRDDEERVASLSTKLNEDVKQMMQFVEVDLND